MSRFGWVQPRQVFDRFTLVYHPVSGLVFAD